MPIILLRERKSVEERFKSSSSRRMVIAGAGDEMKEGRNLKNGITISSFLDFDRVYYVNPTLSSRKRYDDGVRIGFRINI